MKLNEKGKTTIMDKLADIPEQYIYAILAVILIVPLIKPIGLPIPITGDTIKFFDAINALEPGDTVFFAYDALSMTWMEQGLGTMIVMKHLLLKPGIRVVGASSSNQGPPFWEECMNSIGGISSYGKEYGKDVVYLGYLAGGETMEAAIARDIANTVNVDSYGNPLSELDLMSEVNSVDDFALMVCLSSGWSFGGWMDQWVVPYGIGEYVIPLAGVASDIWPLMEAGLIESMIAGSRGAAEYEILLKSPGRAAAGMDAQSLGHIYVAILIIVGNVAYFATRLKGED